MTSSGVRVFAIGAVCALVAIACGGDDAPTGAGGVSGDKLLADLDNKELTAVCDDIQAQSLDDAKLVAKYCYTHGASTGTSQCEDAADECFRKPASFIDPCPNAPMPACTATVRELAQCWSDERARVAGGSKATCSTEIMRLQTAAQTMQEEKDEIARCSALKVSCFFDDGS